MLDLIPPASLDFVGGGDFQGTGREFLSHFIELGGLKPWERVLDVGCGIGRMAIPLAEYLDPSGNYEGFDIVGAGIDWCREKITARYPQFHFQRADLYNTSYNPQGRYLASEYRFPYADASFDFVFLTSVFTHLLPHDLENYLAEVARVLKSGGRMMATFFLLNEESSGLIQAGRSAVRFPHRRGPCACHTLLAPEDAVAYDESAVRRLCAGRGLRVREPIHYGHWCGRPQFLSNHDILVATKERTVPRGRPPVYQRVRNALWRLGRSRLARSVVPRRLAGLFRPRLAALSTEEAVRRHVHGDG